jgi:hypothetical protein
VAAERFCGVHAEVRQVGLRRVVFAGGWIVLCEVLDWSGADCIGLDARNIGTLSTVQHGTMSCCRGLP